MAKDPKLGQARPRQKSNKPSGLKEMAAELNIQGRSNREIAKALNVARDTVPHMLADSDLLKEHRRQLSLLVPQAIKNIDKLLKPSKTVDMELVAKTTMWLL